MIWDKNLAFAIGCGNYLLLFSSAKSLQNSRVYSSSSEDALWNPCQFLQIRIFRKHFALRPFTLHIYKPFSFWNNLKNIILHCKYIEKSGDYLGRKSSCDAFIYLWLRNSLNLSHAVVSFISSLPISHYVGLRSSILMLDL